MSAAGFLSSTKITDFFRGNRRSLYIATIQDKESTVLSNLFCMRKRLIDEFRQEPERMRRLRAIYDLIRESDEVDDVIKALSPSSCQKVNGRHLPLLMESPRLFSQKLPQNASFVLSQIGWGASLYYEVLDILDRSYLIPGDRFYRSVDRDGRPVIAGEDSPTFLSLLGLAHELGHCLLENRNVSETFHSIVASETAAQICEYYLVAEYIKKNNPSTLKDWQVYQSQVDAINFILFLAEADEILGLTGSTSENAAGLSRVSFDQRSYVFRESMMTAPGYQSVYALASLYRRRKLPIFLARLGEEGREIEKEHRGRKGLT